MLLILAFLWGALTGNMHTYGYDPNFPPTNQGIVVTIAPGKCAGWEFTGTQGPFGNVFGLKGGDCS